MRYEREFTVGHLLWGEWWEMSWWLCVSIIVVTLHLGVVMLSSFSSSSCDYRAVGARASLTPSTKFIKFDFLILFLAWAGCSGHLCEKAGCAPLQFPLFLLGALFWVVIFLNLTISGVSLDFLRLFAAGGRLWVLLFLLLLCATGFLSYALPHHTSLLLPSQLTYLFASSLLRVTVLQSVAPLLPHLLKLLLVPHKDFQYSSSCQWLS